jgi:hypothetical protein
MKCQYRNVTMQHHLPCVAFVQEVVQQIKMFGQY